jgi:hypothetical protein
MVAIKLYWFRAAAFGASMASEQKFDGELDRG